MFGLNFNVTLIFHPQQIQKNYFQPWERSQNGTFDEVGWPIGFGKLLCVKVGCAIPHSKALTTPFQ